MEQIKQKIEQAKSTYSASPMGSFYHDPKYTFSESELMSLLEVATEESFVAGMLFKSSSVERPDFTTWWNQFKEEMK